MVNTTLDWFKLAVPEPTDKNRQVQLGVHLEEVGEMLEEIITTDLEINALIMHVEMALDNLSQALKKNAATGLSTVSRTLFLDSLCDQVVTAVGVAHMNGLDIVGALAEVNRSNFSKFGADGKPIFDENGKIAKNLATYTEPDLTPFI